MRARLQGEGVEVGWVEDEGNESQISEEEEVEEGMDGAPVGSQMQI